MPLLEGDQGEDRNRDMSDLNEGTRRELAKLKRRLTLARIVASLALFVWCGACLALELGYAPLSIGAQRAAYVNEGALFLIPAVATGFALHAVGNLRNAAQREDILGLKKKVSPVWGVLGLVFAFVVPGVVLFLSGGSAKKMDPPPAPPSNAVLMVDHLTKYFGVRRTFVDSLKRAPPGFVHAVDDVSFSIDRGEIFGLAGESGSGKTTVLRTALMLTPPSRGSIFFEGVDISRMSTGDLKKYRPKIQVVFQDPYESVNPRMPVFDIVSEGLFINHLVSSREEAVDRVLKVLSEVQMTPPEEYLYRYPHELSGGQRQRVAIARALVLDPDLILADEPVSMLDVSIRAEVINVLLAARDRRNISILMVTHDLALSKDMVDDLAIMYLGKIVESGPATEVVATPYHPYTHALTAAVPVPDPQAPKIRVLARGEIPTNIAPPPGCRFHPRCPFAQPVCSEKEPPLEEVAPGRKVACHFWKEAHESFMKGLDGPAGTNVAT